MPAQWTEIQVDGQPMEAYMTHPEAEGKYPAVVVIQEIWGVNSHIQSVVDRLPAQGYVGLAPAMYHRQGRMAVGLHEELQPALERMRECTDEEIIADVQAAVDFLKAQPFVQPDRIGITGFCFGGRVSYLAASTVPDIKAASVFYGGGMLQALGGSGPSPMERTANINAAVLGLFGEEDQNPTPADVAQIEAELKKNSKTYDFHMYSGAGHGFHCDVRGSYRSEAATDAWARTMAWFDKYVKA